MRKDELRVDLRAGLVLLAFLSVGGFPQLAAAQVFGSIGARAAGLGGVGVALVDDASAVHFNPAGLALRPRGESVLFYGQTTRESEDFVAAIERLGKTDLGELAGGEAGLTQSVRSDLEILSQSGAGVAGMPTTGLYLTQNGIGFSTQGVNWATVAPIVDGVHVEPGDDPETGIANNQSILAYRGLRSQEAVFTYAMELIPRTLAIGVNLKYLHGTTFESSRLVFDVDSSSAQDLADDALRRNSESTDHFSWDAGVLFTPLSFLRMGATARYANSPRFRMKGGGDFRIDRQVRAGLAFVPADSEAFSISADADLVAPEDPLTGEETRYAGVGIEWKLGAVTLRGGARTDLEAEDDVIVPTAGVGLAVKSFRFEVGAAWLEDREMEAVAQVRWILPN